MKKLNVVIDTNILVSILKGSTYLAPIYFAFKEDKFKLVVNSEIIKELAAVLYRPHLKIASNDIKELFRLIKLKALRVKIQPLSISTCRDPKDNFILEIAQAVKTCIIISNDKDLLSLSPFGNIPIITPEEFLDKIKE
mgnify:CR=1 FL=1